MTGIKVGDEVRVLQRGHRCGRDVPEDGYIGTVTKVARKYATATFTQTWTSHAGIGGPGSCEREIRFDMETGTEVPYVEGWYVRTPGQLDRERRRAAALAVIKDAGLEFRLGYGEQRRTLEQLEALADLVKIWEG